MGTTAVEVESCAVTPTPAEVRAAAVELVEKLEQASAARKAAVEAAERLDGLAQQARSRVSRSRFGTRRTGFARTCPGTR
jgi:hypothetical protein